MPIGVDTVIGRVKLWGRVMPFEEGWRGEFAAPVALFRTWQAEDEAKMTALAQAYGAIVEEAPTSLPHGDEFDQLLRKAQAHQLMGISSQMMQQLTQPISWSPRQRRRNGTDLLGAVVAMVAAVFVGSAAALGFATGHRILPSLDVAMALVDSFFAVALWRRWKRGK